MSIAFSRPIVFFDIEKTGTKVDTDRIVQISLLKYFPDGKEEIKTLLVNPSIPIPKEASDVHGITDEMVKDAPTFAQIADEIYNFLINCDLSGFNIHKFDLPLLRYEFARVNRSIDISAINILDPYVIYLKKEPRNLTAAYKYYCDKDLVGAHDAEADIKATKEVFFAQLQRYNDIGTNLNEVAAFSNFNEFRQADISGKLLLDATNNLIYNFGKNKGKLVTDDLDYAKWILGSDFPSDAKNILRQFISNLTRS